MKRGVIIIIVGVLLIALSAVAYLYLSGGLDLGGGARGGAETAEEAEPVATIEPTATPVAEVSILVAVQEIPRGKVIERDSNLNYPIALQPWPVNALPPGAIVAGTREELAGLLPPGVVIAGTESDLDGDGTPDAFEYVVGKQMRTSVVLFEPILDDMLSEQGRIHQAGVGSDVALAAPQDRVVIAYPLPNIEDDPTAAVAYALRPGDHIDLIISLAVVDLDEEFHTMLPNTTQLLDFGEGGEGEEEGGLQLVEFPSGRIEQGPLGLTFNIIPGEDSQRVRLVTQLTVQDAIVMRVGRYPTLEEELLGIDSQAAPTPTATPLARVAGAEPTVQPTAAAAAPAGGQQPPAEPPPPTPTPVPEMPEVIVLAVSPQEALVINFAWEIGAHVSFVLRAVGDEGIYFPTSSVTLQYLMDEYQIAIPPKMQYGIEFPIKSVEELIGEVAQ